MIKLNRLYVPVLIGFVTIVSCDKKSISLEKQVSGIVDSLSKDEKHSYKLFTVQHQSNGIRVSLKYQQLNFLTRILQYIIPRAMATSLSIIRIFSTRIRIRSRI